MKVSSVTDVTVPLGKSFHFLMVWGTKEPLLYSVQGVKEGIVDECFTSVCDMTFAAL